MDRRAFCAGSLAALALPSRARGDASRVFRFINTVDLAVVDPHYSASGVTRDHTHLVFDMLFGQNSDLTFSPQMVDGVLVEDDGKRWILALREGLRFHDGEPVLARDCVASIRRWAQRNGFGGTLLAVTDELSATDDRTLVFRLKKPFPLLPEVLGTFLYPLPAMMPERLAKTDAAVELTEVVGSGPFRYVPDERVADQRVVYERFDHYRPRESGTPSFTAGPKIAYVDRVEWSLMPDWQAGVAALLSGEQDWLRFADFDALPQLRGRGEIRVLPMGSPHPMGGLLLFRMNHLHPPFNNPAIRRALLDAFDQQAIVTAYAGTDPANGQAGIGFFAPESPMASGAGLAAVTGPRDPARAKSEIVAAGYQGEPVVQIGGDIANWRRCSKVLNDAMQGIGLNVRYEPVPMAGLGPRLQSKEPVDQGGWSCFFTELAGVDARDPATHPSLRGNGSKSRIFWPTSPRLEELREAWLDASDLPTRRRIAADIQLQAFRDLPYIPLGMVGAFTAHRADVQGIETGWPIFWNVRKQS